MYDIIVIGAGAAGLTSALYAVRAGMNILLLEKMGVGGQITLTEAVENYPGFSFISGPELMERFAEHVKKFGVEPQLEEVTDVRAEDGARVVATDDNEYRAHAVIVATGSNPRRLGVEGEEKFTGRGVSYCAVCDGPFFKDKEVAVIGGGDAAVKEALYLTQMAAKVTIVHRRDALRAEQIYQAQAFDNPKIELVWDHVVDRMLGSDRFEGIVIRHVKDPEKKRELPVAGVFVYIGHVPNTRFVQVEKTPAGAILTDDCLSSSVPGIYAAGDCRETCLRQIATCVGDGALAAFKAGEYVEQVKSGHRS
ncbi:MAG: thioredoxin-disulfide reductase [Spirochaetota bacterium]